MSVWKSVIGLEIHAQILAKSKLFSGAATKYNARVNDQVSLFDAAIPGTLPVLNRRCVEAAISTAVGLSSHINLVSKFDRKHYFYSDLPAGYQITQQRQPIAVSGCLEYVKYNSASLGGSRSVRIKQIQLEQDSGKSVHDPQASLSMIDLNRAGVGLLEIITEPDLEDGEDAAAFVNELQLLLRTFNVCDGKMEEGSLRVDANVSVMRSDSVELGTRTEVKNLNSIRSLTKAIKFEINRQIDILSTGGQVEYETLSFDANLGCTVEMRDKESERDYRFMPEPNLTPLRLYTDSTVSRVDKSERKNVVNIDDVRRRLPKPPSHWRNKLLNIYGLSPQKVSIVSSNLEWLLFLTKMLEYTDSSGRQPKPHVAHPFFMNNVLKHVKSSPHKTLEKCALTPELAGDVCILIQDEHISLSISHKIVELIFQGDRRQPLKIVEENDWHVISNEERLGVICENLLEERADLTRRYVRLSEKKREKAFDHLTSLVRESHDGRLHTVKSKEILRKHLERKRLEHVGTKT